MANAKYQLDGGDVASIRLSAAKLALAGTPPTEAISVNFFVAATGSSRRRTGVRARGARYTTDVGTVAAPSVKSLFLPKLTQAAYNASPETVVYKGLTWTRSGLKPEDN